VEHYPNSKLAQPAQNKLDALASGQFETKQFSIDPDARYCLLAAVADTTNKKAGQVKFQMMTYCAEHGQSQADVEDYDIPSGGYHIVVAKYIDGKDAARTFCDGFVKQNTELIGDSDKVKVMIVSDDNLQRIPDAAALDAYYNFYLDNY
jgi:hypothetical protein